LSSSPRFTDRVPPVSWMYRFRFTGAFPATACSALATSSLRSVRRAPVVPVLVVDHLVPASAA